MPINKVQVFERTAMHFVVMASTSITSSTSSVQKHRFFDSVKLIADIMAHFSYLLKKQYCFDNCIFFGSHRPFGNFWGLQIMMAQEEDASKTYWWSEERRKLALTISTTDFKSSLFISAFYLRVAAAIAAAILLPLLLLHLLLVAITHFLTCTLPSIQWTEKREEHSSIGWKYYMGARTLRIVEFQAL